ncbi:MAG: aspartate/glutamate racemase family protein [Yoonia sp.]|uniref:aspartate/glutamate racemase family protein n=1 Tax=Yoonia sp. TaxID=2212373 RepID=UPI00273DE307|nr:aspartate/glutamate racemase family protein [Yoonia sp.]MDP5084115.1 aspartate/glutamate racemase family protein [Yoonia sp.]
MVVHPLKIFILNPNATHRMTEEMVTAAQAAVGLSAQVQGLTNSTGPASIQGPDDAAACLTGLFGLFDQAQAQGADAVVVGCFDDTGLGQLRARNSLPVIGLGEAGCIAGSLAASRFSVVTTLEVSVPVIAENVRAMGLWDRCAGIHASGVAVLDLNAGPESIHRVQRAVDLTLASDPDLSIVLGCGGMTCIAPQIMTPRAAQIIDPVVAAAHMCLAAHSLRQN